MELRHLRYFVAVAEELSFTRAAQRLHLSQSPLSRRIQDLEEDIGTALFDRSGHRLELTGAGRMLFKQALSILDQVRSATDDARAIGAGQLGTLRVGYMTAALYHADALALFTRLHQQHPDVRFRFTVMTHGQQLEALLDGRIDVAIAYEDCVQDTALRRQLLARDALQFMFCMDHPLLNAPRLRLAHLADEPFIMPIRADVPLLSEQLYGAWAQRGLAPRVVMETDSFATTAMLVAAGAGVAFGAPQCLRFTNQVALRPAEDFDFQWGAELVWMAERASPLIERLLSALDAFRNSKTATSRAV